MTMGYPSSAWGFLGSVLLMVPLGLLGFAIFAAPAFLFYRRAQASYRADPRLPGRWVVSWGYIPIGALVLMTGLLLPFALNRL